MAVENPLVELAKFAHDTRWQDLPPAVIHDTKFILLDSLGCALGALTTDKAKMNLALARRFGGTPEATIVGAGDKVSLSTAAYTNGELIFTLDFDSIISGGHDAPYVIPTVLAIAESTGASGKDLILATATGIEVSSRVARGVMRVASGGKPVPTRLRRTGNAHSNFGAAAGAARLMKFDQDTMLQAMGIAGHLCMVLTHGRYGSAGHRWMLKYGAPGWQSTGAISAVLLAEMGYTGDTTILEPEIGFGYFAGYLDWQPEKITEGLGKTWVFNNRMHYKPYPCCAVFHGILDCFYAIIEKHNLRPGEIESVKGYGMVGMDAPLYGNTDLKIISDAQFNPRYMLSMAAHRVERGVEWFDGDTMTDPEILKFMDKVTWDVYPDFQQVMAKNPSGSPSKCEVKARGEVFTEERMYQRGTTNTEGQLTDDELIGKFRHNAERVLTQNEIDRAVKAFFELEKLNNISQLIKELTP